MILWRRWGGGRAQCHCATCICRLRRQRILYIQYIVEYIMLKNVIIENIASGVGQITRPTFMAYIMYFVVFFVSLIALKRPQLEIFAYTLFFIANFFYSILIAVDLKNYVFDGMGKNIESIKDLATPLCIIITLVFTFISSIFTFMTINEVREKFNANGQKMELQKSVRNKLDIIETLFYSIVFIVSISVFTLFNKFNAMEYLLQSTGLEKYLFAIKIAIMLLLFIVASVIMHILNTKGKSEIFAKLKSSYATIYSIIVLALSYFPVVYGLKTFGIWLNNDMVFSILGGIGTIVLVAMVIKFMYELFYIYNANTKDVQNAIQSLGLFRIFMAILFIILLILILLPYSFTGMIFKYLFPVCALIMSSYLLRETHDMSTLPRKQLVK